MMYAEEKRKLFRGIVNNNISEKDFISYAKEHIAAPDALIKKWKERYYSGIPIERYPTEPRLVNHFSVGADPEFGFLDKQQYTHASGLGLDTLCAFGCDLSGRQAELRAAPSKFVLEVVASVADELRWLSLAKPATRKCHWISNGFIEGDGFGGHIHFGRKQPSIKAAIKSLDWLSWRLNTAGVLNGAENRRTATRYGRERDYRMQPYGYEYRGMSTWLCNPFIAHLTLTLAKLSILHDLTKAGDKIRELNLANLLAAYQNEDDDARIALQALRLRKCVATGSDDDMKKHWGIYTGTAVNPNSFYPPIIEPSNATKREVFDYLVKGTPMKATIPEATWQPVTLQKDESPLIIQSHVAGLSEVAQGLISKHVTISLRSGVDNNTVFRAPKQFHSLFKEQMKKLELLPNPVCFLSQKDVITIELSRRLSNNFVVDLEVANAYKKVLLSGALPVVEYQNYDKLKTIGLPEVVKNPKIIGRILY